MAAIAHWLFMSRNAARGCLAVHGALPYDQLFKELRRYAASISGCVPRMDDQRIAPDRLECN
jgi:hypothetical protein